jgi:hypothetical protein
MPLMLIVQPSSLPAYVHTGRKFPRRLPNSRRAPQTMWGRVGGGGGGGGGGGTYCRRARHMMSASQKAAPQRFLRRGSFTCNNLVGAARQGWHLAPCRKEPPISETGPLLIVTFKKPPPRAQSTFLPPAIISHPSLSNSANTAVLSPSTHSPPSSSSTMSLKNG